MKTQINTKELTQYKKDISVIERYAESLTVTNHEDYKAALSKGADIKAKLKVITDRKEEIVKPLRVALESVRDLFRPLEDAGNGALKTIKDKMLSFTKEEIRKAQEAKKKIAERVARGTLTVETAVRKIEETATPEKTIVTDEGKATTVNRKAYRVVDKSKVPLDFMEVNMTLVRQSFRAGVPVPGCEPYIENDLKIG